MNGDLNKPFPGFYIPLEIKKLLDKGKDQVLQKDWDRVYIIDGGEGTGKSLLGLQLGFYLDPTLNLTRVTFSGEEFSKAIEKAEKGQAIIFDEAFNGLSSTGALSKMNRFIVRKLMECRQKNLFIIIILPTIFLLQKYVAIFRSKCLFHVYATAKGVRGYYRVYNEQNKKILYLVGGKYYSYSKPYIKNSFRFYGIYPIDEQEYRQKKIKTLKTEEEVPVIHRSTRQRNYLLYYLHKTYGLKYTELAKILEGGTYSLHPTKIGQYIRKITEESQKQNTPLY